MTGAIILAAGRSQRMGAQKLVLPFAGSTVIARVVDAVLGAPLDHTVVVIQRADEQVRAALGDRRVSYAENPDPQGDMLSSVRCGLRVLPVAVGTILVCPGDLPLLTPSLIRGLLARFRAAGRGIGVPVHAGRRGHPLILDGGFRDEVLTAHDGVGLRGLLEAHADEVREWPVDDPAVLADLDTPDDYAQALRSANPM